MVGLFLRLGEHNGDRLAVPVDAVILHDRQVVRTGGLGLAHERRRGIQLRGVAMRHHQDDARSRFGRSGIDLDNPAARNHRVLEGGVGQPLHRELGAEPRLPGHLQRAVNSRNRGADQAMLMVNQRVGLAAGNPNCRARGRRPSSSAPGGLPARRSSHRSVGFGELAEGVRDHPLGKLNLESVVAQALGRG